MSTPPVKKKPGRPRKVVPKKNIPKLGIVHEPSNKDDPDHRSVYVLELVYENPTMFRRIFNLFKAMQVQDIRLRFEPEVVQILTQDRVKKSTIYTVIEGARLNKYYCEKTFEIGLIPDDIQKISQTINNDYSKITIISSRRDEKSKLQIILAYDGIETADKKYIIDVNSVEECDWGVLDELELESSYPIKFELTSRFFKKTIADFKLMSNIMSIQKVGTGLLQMSYIFSNKRGEQYTCFKDPAKINLRSTIKPDDLFSCSVYIPHVKPLSTSLITDTIEISASKEHKLIFTALLDQQEIGKKKQLNTEVCTIKILTEIINLKG